MSEWLTELKDCIARLWRNLNPIGHLLVIFFFVPLVFIYFVCLFKVFNVCFFLKVRRKI